MQDSMKDSSPGSRFAQFQGFPQNQGFVQTQGKAVTNWRALVGQTVQVWRYNEVVDQGRVESVTHDGRVLWLAQSGPIERRLVEKERGTGLRIRLMN